MKHLILILAAGMIGFASCQKTKDAVNKLTEFDINYSDTMTIPATSYSVSMPLDFQAPPVKSNAAATFSSNGTAADHVSEIKMTKMQLTNSKSTFDYIKSISVYLSATGLAEQLIASKTNITPSPTIALDVQNVNIKDYLLKDEMKYRLHVEFSGPIKTDQHIKMEETVHVNATLIN